MAPEDVDDDTAGGGGGAVAMVGTTLVGANGGGCDGNDMEDARGCGARENDGRDGAGGRDALAVEGGVVCGRVSVALSAVDWDAEVSRRVGVTSTGTAVDEVNGDVGRGGAGGITGPS